MRIITFTIVFILLGKLVIAQSCETDGVLHSSYEDVVTIFNTNQCNNCHNINAKESNWSYSTYEDLISIGDCGQKMIVYGDASNSYLYDIITGAQSSCATDEAHVLSNAEVDQIESWINFGAPEKCTELYSEIKDRLNIAGCSSCHSSQSQLWNYANYTSTLESEGSSLCQDFDVIVKGNSESSLLYQKINGEEVNCGEPMQGLNKEDVVAIRDWINAGAPESRNALPVELVYFELESKDSKSLLKWSTSTEVATDKFIIEASGDAKNFEVIGEVSASGNSTSFEEYEYVDDDPIIGRNYYRLKIVDLDGSYDYSNIRVNTIFSDESKIRVYPNPAMSHQKMVVEWFADKSQKQTIMSIVDKKGERIYQKIIFQGINYIRLPELTEGIYYITVIDYFGTNLLERFIVIN